MVFLIRRAALAGHSAEKVAGVKLHPWRGGEQLHLASTALVCCLPMVESYHTQHSRPTHARAHPRVRTPTAHSTRRRAPRSEARCAQACHRRNVGELAKPVTIDHQVVVVPASRTLGASMQEGRQAGPYRQTQGTDHIRPCLPHEQPFAPAQCKMCVVGQAVSRSVGHRICDLRDAGADWLWSREIEASACDRRNLAGGDGGVVHGRDLLAAELQHRV
jgi:hypothetical protein